MPVPPVSRGRRITLRYSPLPGGEKKERPRRPFPADWLSAMTTVPSTAPAFASSLALSLVEVSSE